MGQRDAREAGVGGTAEAYDAEAEETFIPNREILKEYASILTYNDENALGASTGAALQQIKDRHYTQNLEGYVGAILLVGINCDKGNAAKPHSCEIERVEKK